MQETKKIERPQFIALCAAIVKGNPDGLEIPDCVKRAWQSAVESAPKDESPKRGAFMQTASAAWRIVEF